MNLTSPTPDPCPGCGANDGAAPARRENRFLGTAPEDAVLACGNCGLLFRAALPDEAMANNTVAAGTYRWSECTAGTHVASPRMQQRLIRFERKTGRPGHLLDIGCGTGTFLAYAHERGWNVVGTDLRERREATGAMSRLPVIMIDLATADSAEIPDGHYDLVHLSHVLEHTPQPLPLLKAAVRKLRPGGWLCVEVPNEMNSLAAKIKMLLGRPYDSATARFRHRLFFTSKTLTQMVVHAGASEVHVETPVVNLESGWIHRTFDLLQSRLNMGAVLTCTARRPTA